MIRRRLAIPQRKDASSHVAPWRSRDWTAIIALVTSISANLNTTVEFKDSWFDADSDETPEAEYAERLVRSNAVAGTSEADIADVTCALIAVRRPLIHAVSLNKPHVGRSLDAPAFLFASSLLAEAFTFSQLFLSSRLFLNPNSL